MQPGIPDENQKTKIRTHPGKDIIGSSPSYLTHQAGIAVFDPSNLSIPLLSQHEWDMILRISSAKGMIKLGDVAVAYPGELMINSRFKPYLSEKPNEYEIVRGAHINSYFLSPTSKQGEDLFLLKERFLKDHPNSEKAQHHQKARVVYQRYAAIDNYRRLIATIVPSGHFCSHTVGYLWGNFTDLHYFLALLNSKLLDWRFSLTSTNNNVNGYELEALPIPNISRNTPHDERTQLTQQAIARYDAHDNAALLAQTQAAIDADKTDVVHDLLAHLAQRMIDLNKQKQAEVRRFLGWLEARLKIRPGKDGAVGIDSLTGKIILQNYLGDYQKNEPEQPWREFFYRLHQNRNRFAVSLSDIDGEIEREYERSLAALLPVKRELARTDTLIDKIVYRLYGLTDAEIELIERPQYEQALTDAKAQVVADEQITDDEVKIDKIAENILPAAERFFERVEPKPDEDTLDHDLPGWRTLPPAAPTFLLTGDYNLRTLPEQMDFSTSIIPYTKAVEVVLDERIFAPFRAASGYTESDCKNNFLKDFMAGKKHLTLGSFMIILSSSKETALRTFIDRQIHDAANRVFGTNGAVALLNDDQMVHIRNKAAHDEVLTRAEAQAIRAWALGILGQV